MGNDPQDLKDLRERVDDLEKETKDRAFTVAEATRRSLSDQATVNRQVNEDIRGNNKRGLIADVADHATILAELKTRIEFLSMPWKIVIGAMITGIFGLLVFLVEQAITRK